MPRTANNQIHGKVWRFIDYVPRWGADCSKLPKYIKWYINGWEGVDGEVLAALNQLRAEKDFIWIQGALMELLSRSTNTQPQYQGYLLNSQHTPATSIEIGSILRVDGRRALAVLMKLGRVGFLEQVPYDEVDFFKCKPDNGTPLKKPNRTKAARNGTAKKMKRAAGEAKNGDPPFKGKGESAPLVPREKKKVEKETAPLKMPTPLRVGTKENHAALVRGQLAEAAKEEQKQRKNLQDGRHADMPTKADAGGVDTRVTPGRPHVDSTTSVGQVIQFHGYAGHRYDPQAKALAEETIRASRYDGPEANREFGAFASEWHSIIAALPPEGVEYVRGHVQAKALEARSKSNPMSWLIRVLHNRGVDARKKFKAHSRTGVG